MSSPPIDVTRASPRLKTPPRSPCDDEVLRSGGLLCETSKCASREGEHPGQDLFNIALVNKSFSNLSLDSQWGTMHSLDPFISLLNDLETKVDSSDKTLLVNHPLFTKCTNQLRELVLDQGFSEHSGGFPILSAVLLAARLQPSAPIFTGVERITIALPRARDLYGAYGELRALPSVASTAFGEPHTETTILTHALTSLFLILDPGSVQNLILDLPGPGGFSDSILGLAQYLRPFTALRSLSITGYDPGFPIFMLMEWIAGLNHLQSLYIDVLNNGDPPKFIYTLRSEASSIELHLSGPFSFIKPITTIFRDVSRSIKFKVCDIWSTEQGDEIEAFIHSLNHPDLNVTFNEPE